VTRTAALVGLLALSGLAGPAAAGGNSPRVDYMLHCMGCHLEDGRGHPGSVPDMRGVLGRFLQVPGGRAYIIQVPGVAQSSLADAELAEVVNWMLRELSAGSLPPEFEPYTAEEVGRLRARKLTEVGETRRRLLGAFDRQRAAARR